MKRIITYASGVFVLGAAAACLAAAGNPDNGKILFSDPKLAGSQNDTACISCHPGEKPFASISKDRDLAELINMCIEKPLAGKALPVDSQEMQDLKSYILLPEK